MKKLLLSIIMVTATMVASAKYKVGDIYNENGVKGIVVTVTDDGNHGMLMSLTCASERWTDGDLKFETKAFYEDDGQKNMAEIEKYINNSGKSWKDFDLFEWARSLGEGWYIPSSDELLTVMKSINGGSLVYDVKKIQAFDKLIKKGKGKPMISGMPGQPKTFAVMMTSTEVEGGFINSLNIRETGASIAKRALVGGNQKGDFTMVSTVKNAGMGTRSRAVYKF